MTNEFQVPDELLARCVNRMDLVQRVLSSFVEQLDGDIPTLAEFVESGSNEEARKLAHRIKGAAANVAAEQLRANVAKLEELASNKQLADAQGQIEELQESWKTYKDQTATFIYG